MRDYISNIFPFTMDLGSSLYRGFPFIGDFPVQGISLYCLRLSNIFTFTKYFLWQWISMNIEISLIMHFQLEGGSLDHGFLGIRHFPSQWISLYEGPEQAQQGDY